MIWDRHTKHFRGGKEGRRKAVKEREKPLYIWKRLWQEATHLWPNSWGPDTVDPVSMSVFSVCVGSWWAGGGGREKAKSTVWNDGCHKMSSRHQAIWDRTVLLWEQTINLLEPLSSRLCTTHSELWQLPPLMPQCFHFPCRICHRLPLTAPEVCGEDEKYCVYRYTAHWHRLRTPNYDHVMKSFFKCINFSCQKNVGWSCWFHLVQ